MKRDYDTGTSDADVQYFVGDEIEHTPAYGMKTLFESGVHDTETILQLAKDWNVEHIYFGANQSFKTHGADDYDTWSMWEKMITPCIDQKYWCTLDLDLSEVEGLQESHLLESNLFIPQISVKIPYIKHLNYNACIKIDDIDFNRTNPGVWVHNVHDLMDRKVFTDWKKYGKDTIIK